MLVAIDIGNTNITIGLFNNSKLIGNYRLTTKVRRTSDEYGFMLKTFLDNSNIRQENIDDVIVSSVVPKVMHSFVNGIVKFLSIQPIIVAPGIKSGISVQLENPKSVGSDRIADCAGAFYEYGGPVLVVDFGTATTYDYVDRDGNFKAGAISVEITSRHHLHGTVPALLHIGGKRTAVSCFENVNSVLHLLLCDWSQDNTMSEVMPH